MRQLIIAFPDQTLAHKVKTLLQSCGLTTSAICTTAAQVLQNANRLPGGGVVLCPWKLPDLTAQALMELLPDDYDMLVVVTSHQHGMLSSPGLFTLAQPFKTSSLADSVKQLLDTRQIKYTAVLDPDSISGSSERKKSESDKMTSHQRSQEEQKIIEQAKYVLMNRRQMSEAQAHRFLQKKSMESGVRLVELARQILGN